MLQTPCFSVRRFFRKPARRVSLMPVSRRIAAFLVVFALCASAAPLPALGNADADGNDLIGAMYEIMPDGAQEQPAEGVSMSSVTYGASEMGRPLICTVLEPKSYERTILALFAIHGFEDEYPKDGSVLVDVAEKLISYANNSEHLQSSRLMVVACANPDGVIDGESNRGFGRCNALGIDLNRDFDADYLVNKKPRYYTLSPFSAAESRAIRDLVLEYAPDVVLDCHGWLNCTIGDSELADVFKDEMGMKHRRDFGRNCNGFFSYWAHLQGAMALLVEFSGSKFDTEPFLRAMGRLMAGDFSAR